MKLNSFFTRQGQLVSVTAGLVLIGVIGAIDYLTGFEMSFSAFYVLPIALVTWNTNRVTGLIIALLSAIVWFAADTAEGHAYSHPLLPYWNSIIRLTFFVIITLLLSKLKYQLERTRDLAYRDSLTGAANSRYFDELMQKEVDRCQRFGHTFTLVYVDLDNFKAVNDQHGHSTGDKVLRVVVDSMRLNLRRTDLIARLGGDEFALLLPETREAAARVALSKIQTQLLTEMNKNHWPVTFSIGVLTCNAVPATTEALVKMADALMYSVKRDTKNAIRYATYAG